MATKENILAALEGGTTGGRIVGGAKKKKKLRYCEAQAPTITNKCIRYARGKKPQGFTPEFYYSKENMKAEEDFQKLKNELNAEDLNRTVSDNEYQRLINKERDILDSLPPRAVRPTTKEESLELLRMGLEGLGLIGGCCDMSGGGVKKKKLKAKRTPAQIKATEKLVKRNMQFAKARSKNPSLTRAEFFANKVTKKKPIKKVKGAGLKDYSEEVESSEVSSSNEESSSEEEEEDSSSEE